MNTRTYMDYKQTYTYRGINLKITVTILKRFGIVAYACVIVHFLCGLVFIAVTTALRASENGKFSCSLEAESTATYKKQVDQSCFARYDQTYNSPLPLYGFVLLSIGLPVLVSVIYSLIVRIRVDEIESSHERQNNAEDESRGQNRRTVHVFYFYSVHLILRSLVGITSTVLQHIYFYANGFDFKFVCNLPPTDQVKTSKNIQIKQETYFVCNGSNLIIYNMTQQATRNKKFSL